MVRQCQLMGVSRSSLYYRPKETFTTGPVLDEGDGPPVPGNPFLRFQADEGFLGAAGPAGKPEAGAPAAELFVRTAVAMELVDLAVQASWGCGPSTCNLAPAKPAPERRVYPYLLRDLRITRANHVCRRPTSPTMLQAEEMAGDDFGSSGRGQAVAMPDLDHPYHKDRAYAIMDCAQPVRGGLAMAATCPTLWMDRPGVFRAALG